MRRGYVDTPEGQVHYRTEGSGEPLLLLHMAGSSSELFADVMPILGKTCRVIAMDILGYGKSDFPPHTYRIEDYGRNIIHVLDALDIDKANVLGRLTGSAIAVELAAAYPARVDKLILQSSFFLEPEQMKSRQDAYRDKGMKIKADGSHIMEWWRLRMARPHMTPEMAHRHLCTLLEAGQGLKAEDGERAMFVYDWETKLALIKSPTLVLFGAGDVRVDRMEVTARLIPRSRTRIIEDAWIYPPWSKPGEFSEAILDFLKNPGV